MRYACLVMAVVFSLFTYWQFNDLTQYNTDLWYGWVVAYALCVVVSLVSWWKALPRSFYLTGALLALGCALYRALAIEWEKTVLYNETNPSGNESGGLLIIALWWGILAWKQRSLGSPSKKS